MYSSTIQYNTIILEPKRCLFRSRSPPYPALPSEHHSQFSPSIPVWVFSTHASLLLCYQLSWKSSPPTITSYHHRRPKRPSGKIQHFRYHLPSWTFSQFGLIYSKMLNPFMCLGVGSMSLLRGLQHLRPHSDISFHGFLLYNILFLSAQPTCTTFATPVAVEIRTGRLFK